MTWLPGLIIELGPTSPLFSEVVLQWSPELKSAWFRVSGSMQPLRILTCWDTLGIQLVTWSRVQHNTFGDQITATHIVCQVCFARRIGVGVLVNDKTPRADFFGSTSDNVLLVGLAHKPRSMCCRSMTLTGTSAPRCCPSSGL